MKDRKTQWKKIIEEAGEVKIEEKRKEEVVTQGGDSWGCECKDGKRRRI